MNPYHAVTGLITINHEDALIFLLPEHGQFWEMGENAGLSAEHFPRFLTMFSKAFPLTLSQTNPGFCVSAVQVF